MTSRFVTGSYLLIIILSILGLLFAIIFILSILLYRISHTVTYLLMANVCLASSAYFIIVLYNHINGLFYQTLSPISCVVVSYLMVSGASSISYSLMLQALSRFLFIIFYRNKYLLSYGFHLLLLLFCWLISYTLVPIPCVFAKGLTYESSLYLCALNTNSIFVIVYVMFTGCLIPFSVIGIVYFYIMLYLRQQSNTSVIPSMIVNTNSNQKKIDRNLAVLRNIMINVTIISVTGSPSFVIMILILLRKAPVVTTIYFTLFTLLGVVLMTLTSFSRTKNVRETFFKFICCRKIN